MKCDVYVTGPISTKSQREFLTKLNRLCIDAGLSYSTVLDDYDIWKSRLFTITEQLKKISSLDFSTMLEQKQMLKPFLEEQNSIVNEIFNLAISRITSCKFMLAWIDGQDSKTMFEIGYAAAKNIPIVTYTTINTPCNIMVSQSTVCHVDGSRTLNDQYKYPDIFKVLKMLPEFIEKYNAQDLREQLFEVIERLDTFVLKEYCIDEEYVSKNSQSCRYSTEWNESNNE